MISTLRDRVLTYPFYAYFFDAETCMNCLDFTFVDYDDAFANLEALPTEKCYKGINISLCVFNILPVTDFPNCLKISEKKQINRPFLSIQLVELLNHSATFQQFYCSK